MGKIEEEDIRICFFGDSLVNGTGDRQALGWTGRVCAAANHTKFVVTHYNLGIRRNTSEDVLARWRSEFEKRSVSSADCRMVFSFGVNDTVIENNETRVSEASSIENAGSIIKHSAELAPVLWVGPTPVDDEQQNIRIKSLCQKLEQIACELEVKYIPVFDSLKKSTVWMDEVRDGDGSHPDAQGYEVLSDLILRESPWWS